MTTRPNPVTLLEATMVLALRLNRRNNAAGFKVFATHYKALISSSLIVIEYTDGYETAFAKFALMKKFTLHCASGAKTRPHANSIGIGATTARMLLVQMPELGSLTRRSVAALGRCRPATACRA